MRSRFKKWCPIGHPGHSKSVSKYDREYVSKKRYNQIYKCEICHNIFKKEVLIELNCYMKHMNKHTHWKGQDGKGTEWKG